MGVGCMLTCSLLAAHIRNTSACDWGNYHPLRIGTPIRGGHDRLAIFKVIPKYPRSLREKSLRAKVTSEVLIDRSGSVVRTCSHGEPAFAKATDEALAQWKFVKNFGMVSEHPERGPQFAVLLVSFEFIPDKPTVY